MYIVKPEYWSLFGSDYEGEKLYLFQLKYFALEWEKQLDEILEMCEEVQYED